MSWEEGTGNREQGTGAQYGDPAQIGEVIERTSRAGESAAQREAERHTADARQRAHVQQIDAWQEENQARLRACRSLHVFRPLRHEEPGFNHYWHVCELCGGMVREGVKEGYMMHEMDLARLRRGTPAVELATDLKR